MNILASPADSPTDAMLIHRWVQNHEQSAARALYERHQESVRRIAARHAYSKEEIDDACQVIWQGIFAALPHFDATRRFPNWLHHIARCLAMRHGGQSQVHESRFPASDLSAQEIVGQEPRTETTGADIAMHRETLHLLERGMAAWKSRDRQLFQLVRLENTDAREASRRLGISENAARIRLTRLSHRLRELQAKCA